MLASLNTPSVRATRPFGRATRAARGVQCVRCVAQPSSPAARRAAARSDAGAGPLFLGAMAAPFLLDIGTAMAANKEFGLLEGRTAALLHPAAMISLFVATGYAGWLGWQWRRARTIGEDIKALKAQLPKPAGDEPAPPSPLSGQVEALEKERKELVAGGYRDKHFVLGSVLLGAGVLFSIEGGLNTWLRTGKLFPGPHLFAGAGITVLWALAAALVPSMQKGNEGARNAHIALNALNLALFAWQVPTGLEIVGKVFEFTSWP